MSTSYLESAAAPFTPRLTTTAVGMRMDLSFSAHFPVFGQLLTYIAPTREVVDFHEAFEFGVVLTGAMERTWGDYRTRLRPGEVWLCGLWEPHGWRALHSGSTVVVTVFLPNCLAEMEDASSVPWLAMFRADPDKRPKVTGQNLRAVLLEEGKMMAREISEVKPGWTEVLRAHLLRCLCHLATEWHTSRVDNGASSEVVSLARIRPALALAANSSLPVRLSQAAAACHISRTRFAALFTHVMGISFGRFCRQVRIGQAARLLRATDFSLDTIAERCGFSSAPHLHRVFTSHFTCTPGAYRARGGGGTA